MSWVYSRTHHSRGKKKLKQNPIPRCNLLQSWFIPDFVFAFSFLHHDEQPTIFSPPNAEMKMQIWRKKEKKTSEDGKMQGFGADEFFTHSDSSSGFFLG